MTRTEAIKKGKKTYSSGMPCHAGHNAKRYVTSRRCVKCDAISSKQKSKKQKPNFAEYLKSLTKKSIKEINKMSEIENIVHRLKSIMIAEATLGNNKIRYCAIPEIDELLRAEGLEIKDNKIIW